MKVSGFTILRNTVFYAYPFKEAIRSILPLCDEMIINVGRSDDNTLEEVKLINDKKIRILESQWDTNLKDGKVLSTETNKALKECSGDWCFYIQGDEILHEKYYELINKEMRKYLNNDKVEGLRFRYKHFYGSYNFYQDNYRKWYTKEVRILKNNKNIISWGDAMDFKHEDGTKIFSIDIDAEIYHYGWVKPPDKLIQKRKDFELLYNSIEVAEQNISSFKNYDDLGNLKRFKDTHPKVMEERILKSNWDFDGQLEKQNPDWLRKILIFIYPVTKRIKGLFQKT